MSKRGARQRQAWTTPRRKPPTAVPDESPPSIDPRAAEILAYWKSQAETARAKSQAEAQKWSGRLGFVYFIQDGVDGPVKIGRADDPAGRLIELQCGNPRPLRLVQVVLGGVDTERELHRFWRDPKWLKCAWIRNEWFGLGHEQAILAMGARIAELQVSAVEAGGTLDDVRTKIVRRGMFQRSDAQEAA